MASTATPGHTCLAEPAALEAFLTLWAGWSARDTGPLAAALGGAHAVAATAALAARLSPPTPAARQLARRQVHALGLLRSTCVPWCCLPPALAAARPAPPALFVRGPVGLLGRAGWAVVGARTAGVGTCAYAHRVAARVAKSGEVVISGGARGIDAAAHRGALAAGGATVVVLGVPADCVYPAAHRPLFGDVLGAGGALVHELPPCVPAPAYWHARRNRLIAAAARQVLVVEAAEGSGSLGTARAALGLGRPVWVPPPQVGGERRGLAALMAAGRAQVLAGWPGGEAG